MFDRDLFGIFFGSGARRCGSGDGDNDTSTVPGGVVGGAGGWPPVGGRAPSGVWGLTRSRAPSGVWGLGTGGGV